MHTLGVSRRKIFVPFNAVLQQCPIHSLIAPISVTIWNVLCVFSQLKTQSGSFIAFQLMLGDFTERQKTTYNEKFYDFSHFKL